MICIIVLCYWNSCDSLTHPSVNIVNLIITYWFIDLIWNCSRCVSGGTGSMTMVRCIWKSSARWVERRRSCCSSRRRRQPWCERSPVTWRNGKPRWAGEWTGQHGQDADVRPTEACQEEARRAAQGVRTVRETAEQERQPPWQEDRDDWLCCTSVRQQQQQPS